MISVGIIAAGEGSRFQSFAPQTIKPMIPVAGKPLVHWTVSHLQAAGARSITYLHNSRGGAAKNYLRSEFRDIDWTFLEKDAPSSWESFRWVASELARSSREFAITTVDALVSPSDLSRFCGPIALNGHFDGALALTRFVEDEKPLWADCDGSGRITAIGSMAKRREFATCGLYRLSRNLAEDFPALPAYGRLRDFWTNVVESNRNMLGVPLSKTIDVDRPEDLSAAEAFIRSLEDYAPAR